MVYSVWKILSQPGLLGLTFALAVCGTVAAQPTPPTSGAGQPETMGQTNPPVKVEESKPSITYWAKDAEGKLVPLIGMNYETIRELWDYHRQLTGPEQPARFSIQQWTASGVVNGSWAELDVKIQLVVNVDQWCRIPLGLNGAVLKAPIEYEGPGEHISGVEKETGGYVAWIRGGDKGVHTLGMKIFVPLERLLGETRLRLRPPPAVNSRLTVTVNSEKATATVSDGASLLPLEHPGDGTTDLTVVGLGEDLQLAWQLADDRPGGPPAVLEVKGDLLVKVGELSGVSTEGRLTVRSSNGPLPSFLIKLPPGARALASKQPAYEISNLDAAKPKRNGNGSGNGGSNGSSIAKFSLVEVKINQPTSDPVTVRLDTRQSITDPRPGARTEVALMEVVDAVRQSGSITLQVTGDASVDWLEGEGVVRVDEPPEGETRDGVVAWFEYSQQPCSLGLRVVPKSTRVSVEPRYVAEVASDAVRLHAQLTYDVRGAKTDLLELDLSGWQLDSVEPAALVKTDALKTLLGQNPAETRFRRIGSELARWGAAVGVPQFWPLRLSAEAVTPVGPPVVQIPLAQPSSGRIVIDLHAHRVVNPGVKRIEFSLPRPASAVVSGASLVVLPDDNVRLEPRPDELRGLVAEQNPPRIELPVRTQEPLYYREQADASEALFVSGFEVHRRRVTVEQATHVETNSRQAKVKQQLRYRIAYEPLECLILNVPGDFLRMDNLTLTCDGVALDPASLVTGETGGDDLTELRVPLSAARIGTCEVDAEYTMPVERVGREEASEVPLPLVVPISGEPPGDAESETFIYRGHVLTTELPNDIRMEPPGAPWTALENSAGDTDRDKRYSAEQPVTQVQLQLLFAGARGAEVTLVRKAWIQLWLASTTRRDRAAFRVRTAAGQILLHLPAGADAANVDLYLDGLPVVPRQVGELELLIELSGQFGQREYLVELWYPFKVGRPPRGAMSLGLPHVANADWVERMYCQVLLPPDEQLVGLPAEMTSEMTWGWRGVRWGSRPQLTAADLESWMDTAWACDVPAGANQYLFSRFGSLETVQLHTSSRSLVVLIASGGLLAAGLLWIYVPLIRQAWIVLLAICGFGFVAAAYPEPAVFAAQAAAAGLALVVVARLMHWAVVERRTPPAVIHGTSMIPVERSTTATLLRSPKGSSHGGSGTIPAGPPLPAPGS